MMASGRQHEADDERDEKEAFYNEISCSGRHLLLPPSLWLISIYPLHNAVPMDGWEPLAGPHGRKKRDHLTNTLKGGGRNNYCMMQFRDMRVA